MSANNEYLLQDADLPPPTCTDLPVRSKDKRFNAPMRWAESRARLRASQEEQHVNQHNGNTQQRNSLSARISELKHRYYMEALEKVVLNQGAAGYPADLVEDLEELYRIETKKKDQCIKDIQKWRIKFEAKFKECVELSNQVASLEQSRGQNADQGMGRSESLIMVNEDPVKCRQEFQMCKEKIGEASLQLARIVMNESFVCEPTCNDNQVPTSTVTLSTTPNSASTLVASNPKSVDSMTQARSSTSRAPSVTTHVDLPTLKPIEVEVHFQPQLLFPGEGGQEENGVRKESGLKTPRLSVSQDGLITKNRKEVIVRIVLPSSRKPPSELKLPSTMRNNHV